MNKSEDRSNKRKNEMVPTEERNVDGISATTSKMAAHGDVQQFPTEGAPGGFRQEGQS